MLWAGVSPPTPFDWKRSVEDRYVVYGSSMQRYIYPDDLAIKRFRELGNVLMFHGENAWVHWQMDLTPTDLENHKRILETAREFGMRVAFYTPPKVFLTGSPIKVRATPDVDDPKASGWPTGGNLLECLRQAQRLVKEFDVTGASVVTGVTLPVDWATSIDLRDPPDGKRAIVAGKLQHDS